ncbi:MAG: lactoylglutathione lyase [Acidimicrobiia bacterium]|nr:lactoylglutathione lyase [Acidimicrobiia bacterium]
MELRGVHHISLNVADAAATERFYVDVLGLKPLDRPDFGFPGAWLACQDGRQVHLIQVDDWVAPKGQHFAFAVEDIEGVRGELAAKGIKVSDTSVVPGAGRQCFFKDPAGNLVELNQPAGAGVA